MPSMQHAYVHDLFLDVGPDVTLAGTGRPATSQRTSSCASGDPTPRGHRHRASPTTRAGRAHRPRRSGRGPRSSNGSAGAAGVEPVHFDAIDTSPTPSSSSSTTRTCAEARPGWTVRRSPDLEDALASDARRMGRCSPAGRTSASSSSRKAVDPSAAHQDADVTIRGPIGECVLYVYGRKDVARVKLDGPRRCRRRGRCRAVRALRRAADRGRDQG